MSDIVFFVLARAGSKRCPGKNTRLFVSFPNSQSIVNVAIGKCMMMAKDLDAKVILDTDITGLASSYRHLKGKHKMGEERLVVIDREPRFCGDDVDPADIMLSHIIPLDEQERPKYVVLTQATSPFWSRSDLMNAIKQVRDGHMSGMFSVNPSYKPNGCFYIVRTRDFIEQKTLFVDGCCICRLPWQDSIDIDHPWDFRAAQAVANRTVIDLTGGGDD